MVDIRELCPLIPPLFGLFPGDTAVCLWYPSQMRAALALSFLAAGLAYSPSASADSFDTLADAAEPVHTAANMAALFWSQQTRCDDNNDMARRQCKGVKQARRTWVAAQTYLLDVGPALEVSLNTDALSAEISLRSCLACEELGDLIVGKGTRRVEGNAIKAPIVASLTKIFEDLASAEHWNKHIASRLRAQFLVRLPRSLSKFTVADRPGYTVEVVGYRLYDPCTGEVLAAAPESAQGPVNASACEAEPELPKPEAPPAPKLPDHPDRLNTSQIKRAMSKVGADARRCFDAYGIEGMATFELVIAANGTLRKSKQSGDFEGTPTGTCLDAAMELARFPKSKKKSTPITFPIMLR